MLIGDDVEIEAGTVIGRATLDDMIIGQNTKIDDQVFIAHNVQIGPNASIRNGITFGDNSLDGCGGNEIGFG